MNIDNLRKYLDDIQTKLKDLNTLENVKIEEDDFNKLNSSIQELGLVTQEISFKSDLKSNYNEIIYDLLELNQNIKTSRSEIKLEIANYSSKITTTIQESIINNSKSIKEELNNLNNKNTKELKDLKDLIKEQSDYIKSTLKSDISTLKYEISDLKRNIEKNTTETKNLKDEIEKIGKQVGNNKTGIIEEIVKMFKKPEPLANNLPNTNKPSENNNSGTNTQNGK